MDQPTEARDKLEKRGYVYRCQGCQQYEGEKRYVEAHYMKYHTSLDARRTILLQSLSLHGEDRKGAGKTC